MNLIIVFIKLGIFQKNDYKLIAIEHADNVISFSNYQQI